MRFFILGLTLFLGISVRAANFDGNILEWRKEGQKFSNPEKTFKEVFSRLKEKYVDQSVTDEELYRAATEGMLAALSTGEESWNKLLTPREYEDLKIEMSGTLTGIGATLSFNAETGTALVQNVIPNTGAQRAGLKRGDQILSVEGQRFKGKTLPEMVSVLRGPSGKSVEIKILREDNVIPLKIVRGAIKLQLFEAKKIDETTGYLTISAFTGDSLQEVESRLKTFADQKLKKLIIDLRGNQGGGFDQVLQVAEIFSPKGSVMARTKSRHGKSKEYTSQKEAWNPDAHLVVLVDHKTKSGAELLAASLKENRHAVVIGATTYGKWNVQSIEDLPNHFLVKYSIMDFESPSGKNYQGVGLKPDYEVAGPAEASLGEWSQEGTEMSVRLTHDAQLKAAHGL